MTTLTSVWHPYFDVYSCRLCKDKAPLTNKQLGSEHACTLVPSATGQLQIGGQVTRRRRGVHHTLVTENQHLV